MPLDSLEKEILEDIIRLNNSLSRRLEFISQLSSDEEFKLVTALISKSQESKQTILQSYL